jgi:hypothetical protein
VPGRDVGSLAIDCVNLVHLLLVKLLGFISTVVGIVLVVTVAG